MKFFFCIFFLSSVWVGKKTEKKNKKQNDIINAPLPLKSLGQSHDLWFVIKEIFTTFIFIGTGDVYFLWYLVMGDFNNNNKKQKKNNILDSNCEKVDRWVFRPPLLLIIIIIIHEKVFLLWYIFELILLFVCWLSFSLLFFFISGDWKKSL